MVPGWSRSIRRAIVLSVLSALYGAALAGPASAATLSAPANVLLRATVKVSASSADVTGTVELQVDGRRVTTRAISPSTSTYFSGIPLAKGRHKLKGVLTDEHGAVTTTTPEITVVSWERVGASKVITPGSVAGKRIPIRVKTGSNSTTVIVYLNGVKKISKRVSARREVTVGYLWLTRTRNRLSVRTSNPVSTSWRRMTVRRVKSPWPTGIVIDKSEFRLYLFKNWRLVKWYRVAIGKNGTPTPERMWKVGMKHYTSPGSVYGPRKLRLFKRVRGRTGYHYVYTNYAIHGTNEPWVIGTKASHGCIRLHNKRILDLFPRVPVGTKVQTRR